MMGSDPNAGFYHRSFNPARQIPVLRNILTHCNLLDLYYEKEGALRWEQNIVCDSCSTILRKIPSGTRSSETSVR